ncbi:hypothetical protein CPB83DRAFT_835656 [Crepidotus variabilis]|uniref:Uncharacterized protein n=1 Tax=Crepidotus variabilis TaxID=179855 RepID=A0A9P6EGS2_9AGAR|nr:hypothetical protein CPB83DRAFT_835656 [Crepidotus variabilis]
MVKFTAPIVYAALLAGSVIAMPLSTRAIGDQDIMVAREDFNAVDIYGRDLSMDDLEEREPFGIGMAFKAIKGIFKIGKHARHAQNNNNNNKHKRSLDFEEDEVLERDLSVDDLEEREPFGIGMAFKAIKGIFKIGKHARHAQNNNNNNKHKRSLDFEEDEVLERDLSVDDLEEREPFGIGMAFKAIKGIFKIGKHARHAQNNNNNNKHKRSLDFEEDEVLERDLSVDDLEEREPFGIGMAFKAIKGVFKIGKHARHAQNNNNNNNNKKHKRSLDFEEDEVLEREYYDELD